jgi:hypothetical protein
MNGLPLPGRSPILPSLRCLLARSEQIIYETPEETVNGILSSFHGTAEEFIFLQQECCPTYYQMPQWTRVAVAASCSWNAHHMPELIRTALGKDPLSVTNLQTEGLSRCYRNGTTLVNTIAKHIGESLASRTLLNKHEEKQKLLYEAWNAFFFEFMAAGIDIHHIAGQQTPFAAFLCGFF